MLIKSWLSLNLVLAQEEITISYKRLNLANCKMSLRFSSQFCKDCETSLTTFFHSKGLEYNKNEIPVLTFSQYIIETLVAFQKKNHHILVNLMAAFYSSSPVLLRIYKFGTD